LKHLISKKLQLQTLALFFFDSVVYVVVFTGHSIAQLTCYWHCCRQPQGLEPARQPVVGSSFAHAPTGHKVWLCRQQPPADRDSAPSHTCGPNSLWRTACTMRLIYKNIQITLILSISMSSDYIFRVTGHLSTPPENWTVRAFLQLTPRLSNDFTAAWLTFTFPQLFAVAATLKFIDYNVAMTFILIIIIIIISAIKTTNKFTNKNTRYTQAGRVK